MTLYNYFGSKEGLLESAIERMMNQMLNEIIKLIDSTTSPLDGLIAISKLEMGRSLSGQFLSDLIQYYPHLLERMKKSK